MQRAVRDPEILDRSVAEVMGPPLPSVGSGESVELALRRLEESPAVIVLDNGHPVGVITRSGRARVPGPSRLAEGDSMNPSNDQAGRGPGSRRERSTPARTPIRSPERS